MQRCTQEWEIVYTGEWEMVYTGTQQAPQAPGGLSDGSASLEIMLPPVAPSGFVPDIGSYIYIIVLKPLKPLSTYQPDLRIEMM